MEKLFFEAFPNLQLDTDLCNVLQDTMVTEVSINEGKDLISIYLSCSTLIPKRRIYKLENDIKKQVFAEDNVKVRVVDRYKLSSQYNASNFVKEYQDSFLDIFNKRGSGVMSVIRKASFEFPDEKHMNIVLEDSILAKAFSEEIYGVYDFVMCDSCGIDVIIDITYKEAPKTDYAQRTQVKMENEIAEIVRRREEAIKASEEEQEESLGAKEEKPKNTANSSTKKPENKSKYTESNKKNEEYNRPISIIRSRHKDVIYGKDFDDDTIDIVNLNDDELGNMVTIRGQIFGIETREIRGEKTIAILSIYDSTDSINVKLFLRNDNMEEFNSNFKKGAFVKVKALLEFDTYSEEIGLNKVFGVMTTADYTVTRMDNEYEKRVELHCHTKMSEMDGVSSVADIFKQAKKWGHKAIAITDHGVVQAFTDHGLNYDDPDTKIILGCEAYIVDDSKRVVVNSKNQPLNTTFVLLDINTTGFQANEDKLIEVAATKLEGIDMIDKYNTFVNPLCPVPYEIYQTTRISDENVVSAPTAEEVLPKLIEFCKDAVIVSHNAEFNVNFIKAKAKELGLEFDCTYIDTTALSRYLLTLQRYELRRVAKHFKVDLPEFYRALDAVNCLEEIFKRLMTQLKQRDIKTLDELNDKAAIDEQGIRNLQSYHCIVLAKNDIGRINLYRLVSESHLKYFRNRPKMPKSLINKYREGLIIGSACEAGELYRGILEGKGEDEIINIASFYDYLEIQPVGNNKFMIESERYKNINSFDDIREINKYIVNLGEKLDKPVCATCDVHFLNPEDEVYRRIIMAGKGFADADDQAPLYLHTTEEMLDEFEYLGSEKAREIVITNTNLIADMCDRIKPVRPDKAPPVIENSDEQLREICYNKAHEMYGPNLPEQVEARLERELNSIITNGYAVMYIIAQKLVWKSVEDGYLVGSRGSVGSSFAATMSGITEVNPLSPHYLCKECYYVDFDSDEVKEFSGRAGCDMPDKICPKCGANLSKEGFDIPFETFLGFKGDKEPDIDLNFSSDYQSKAHKYTEVIFGDGQTFKAGTIGGLAEKTAYGYIKKYYEERKINKRECEINRLVGGCEGVRRTTGQHPGGIVVLPVGENMYSFTPIQHPANDMTSSTITTHFDYHSIDSNLLKLDILGHDDPNMIRMLEDLTDVDATKIPLDDKDVMSLFMNTKSLGLEPSEMWDNCDLGTLGIPEFGTDFAMGMLRDAKPKEFSDLVRISGLSHGTDVWLNNAQDLILNGIATISTAICTRDDIMTYLIHMGLDSQDAFTIMENVRKGKVAKGAVADKWAVWQEDMRAHNVPDWYIGSCEKIKYMFPKAHAVAYVMMAWRIAYFKVNYPLAYYAAYFSIRAKAFNYELMCQGKEMIEFHLKEYSSCDNLSNKEKDEYADMRLVQEMYARGLEFLPVDLYKSDSRYFKIEDGKLRPPFIAIEGMGESACDNLMVAASESKFISKDDIRNRGKVSKTVIETFDKLGITEGLPDSNQISLFDFA